MNRPGSVNAGAVPENFGESECPGYSENFLPGSPLVLSVPFLQISVISDGF